MTDKTVPPLSHFKVLTFDVVGTLIDFEAGIINGVNQIATPLGRTVDPEVALDAYRAALEHSGTLRFPDNMVNRWPLMAASLDLPDTEANGKIMVEALAESPAFPDSAAALARLGKHYKLVAATNAQRWALTRYEAKLGHPFDFTFTVDEVGTTKPDPAYFEFFLATLAEQGFAKADILHTAQSQYHDIGVSRRLGFTNCWIERRHAQKGSGGTQIAERTEPDYHFTSLAALADAVEGAGAVTA